MRNVCTLSLHAINLDRLGRLGALQALHTQAQADLAALLAARDAIQPGPANSACSVFPRQRLRGVLTLLLVGNPPASGPIAAGAFDLICSLFQEFDEIRYGVAARCTQYSQNWTPERLVLQTCWRICS